MKKEYKSSPSRLIKFFEDSRDTWKSKALKAKEELKNVKKKFKYTKEKLQNLRSEYTELKNSIPEHKESTKKKQIK